MLRLLHLSDIHFRPALARDSRDVNLAVRRDLLADLGALADEITPVDAVLVVGDLAARGKDEEFDLARAFLEETCKLVGCDPKHVACVPGNHDIDRDGHTQLHDGLRRLLRTEEPGRIDDRLERIFADTEASTVLHAPLAAYNRFARPFGFAVTAEEPVPRGWDLPLGEHTLRIRGVNSALISDGTDAYEDDLRRVVLGANQLSVLAEDHDVITVLMCHHPPRWLRDADHVQPWLARPHLLLTGHEHELGIVPHPDGAGLTIASGAVNPDRAHEDWAPAYNVLQLDVEDGLLSVSVLVRCYGKERTGFIADPKFGDPQLYRIPLSRAATPTPVPVQVVSDSRAVPGPPVQSDEREMIFDILSVAPDMRERAARRLGLLEPGDGLRRPEDEDALIGRARTKGIIAELAREVRSA